MRRALYWVGVLVGILLICGGVVVGAQGYRAAASPAGVVRGYFAALTHADAARALAYGTVPGGPHELLTDAALREQQHIAPMRDVSVGDTAEHGGHAEVKVTYTLAFPERDVDVSTRVALHRAAGNWRLDQAAIPVELFARGARQRESILGGRVPDGTLLLFPGALPIRLDTPYLRLDPARDQVSFGALSSTAVYVQVSDAGRAAMQQAVRAALRRCLTGVGGGEAACPQPDQRYVPGSIRGVVRGRARAASVIVESVEPVGTLRFSGSVSVAGTWRRLDFHNREAPGRGRIQLDLHAVAYATKPLRLRWLPT